MTIRFTPRALRELSSISAYINERNPQGALRVRDAIFATIDLLVRSPLLGRRQNRSGLRKLVVPKYPYLIYYSVDMKRDVTIVKIRHAARKRLYRDE